MRADEIKALMDGLSLQDRREREKSQLTLGQLLDTLAQLPPDTPVANLREAHSYRGYYEDLAFECPAGTRPAGELLAECRAAMGEVFEGYKGGEYVMGRNTPLWVASWGCTGRKLLTLKHHVELELADYED